MYSVARLNKCRRLPLLNHQSSAGGRGGYASKRTQLSKMTMKQSSKAKDSINQQVADSGLSRRLWYSQVYLRSDHWQEIRAKALASSNFCCQGCSATKKLQVHHLTYNTLGSETVDDLMVLCDSCHSLSHELLGEMRATLDVATHRRVLSHFLYYATTPKHERETQKKAKKNHRFNKLPMSIRNLVSRAKKAIQSQ